MVSSTTIVPPSVLYGSATDKQAVGSPPNGEQHAVIKLFDRDFNLLRKELVRSVVWGLGGGELRPSLDFIGNRIYSGEDVSLSIGTGNAEISVYDIN